MSKIIAIHTRSTRRPAPDAQARPRLHPDGLYRWSELKEVLPVGRETWRLKVIAGHAPQPVRLGTRCTSWRGSDVLVWLADPDGYRCKPE